jgi:hypothetical protein
MYCYLQRNGEGGEAEEKIEATKTRKIYGIFFWAECTGKEPSLRA